MTPELTNERWLSPISLVEIALKVRLGKLPLSAPFGVLFPAQLAANRVQLYPERFLAPSSGSRQPSGRLRGRRKR